MFCSLYHTKDAAQSGESRGQGPIPGERVNRNSNSVHSFGAIPLMNTSRRRYSRLRDIDYRISDPELDGNTKNDHFLAMLKQAFTTKGIIATFVLFDSWYSGADNLKYIHRAGRIFATTLKSNRLISVDKEQGYIHLDELKWTPEQLLHGQSVKLKTVPFFVRLFKLVTPDGDIDWVITNSDDSTFTIDSVKAQQKRRWAIEPFHREIKQLTGSERCQCRKAKSQRNHLACCYHALTTVQKRCAKN